MAQKQGRNAYRRQLIAEFNAFLPPQLFRGLEIHGNAQWTPRMVVCLRIDPKMLVPSRYRVVFVPLEHNREGMIQLSGEPLTVIMFGHGGNTLEEQFAQARHVVKFMWPHWRVPVSYAGFVAAQQRWRPLILPLLRMQLRPGPGVGASWRVLGWLALDGSRFEAPRTQANEQGWKLISFWMLQRIAIGHQIAGGLPPRRFSPAQARRHIREVLQLIQQGRSGPSLKQRCMEMQVDTDTRNGPKTPRPNPRKKMTRLQTAL